MLLAFSQSAQQVQQHARPAQTVAHRPESDPTVVSFLTASFQLFIAFLGANGRRVGGVGGCAFWGGVADACGLVARAEAGGGLHGLNVAGSD